MTMIRAMVVDDEPLARLRLRQLLEDSGDVEIVECANGAEALAASRRQDADVLFLDVQMPAMDGFSVLDRMNVERRPVVVFVTAYDAYAVRAFERCALDYLLKPFDDVRFAKTMARIRERLDGRPRAPRALYFAVGRADGIRIVPVAEVDRVAAAGNYVELHTAAGTLLHRESLRSIEARMPGTMLRVHRSTLVNTTHVERLEWTDHGDGVAVLRGGGSVRVSRRYSGGVRGTFGPVRTRGRPA